MDMGYNLNKPMLRLGRTHASSFIIAITAVVLVASVFFFREARDFIGKPYPGFLAFKNNMVGAFSGFDWPGYQAGVRYHDIIVSQEDSTHYNVLTAGRMLTMNIEGSTFSLKDFLIVFFAPFASGMFYLILAIIIFVVGRHMKGIVPFFLFNLGIAYYLIASFDFHTNHSASWMFLLAFVLLPSFMTHFALVFPEELGTVKRHRWLILAPYILSLLIYIPYAYSFYRDPHSWIWWERAVVSYVVLSYLFWIATLSRNAQRAARDTDRIAATYLLFGQLIAFLIPLTAAVAIFIFRRNIPLNAIAPITVVLPIASLFGIVLGNLRNAQLKLVQSEKMASLGQLVAGVAHEINNPTTFIYSNIAMLRDYVAYVRGALKPDAAKFKGEMSANDVIDDLEKLVGTVSEGATRIKDIVSDLRRFGHSQDDAVTPVHIRVGMESTINLLHHEISEGISVHLDIPQTLAINANSGQINQLWMNILSNAVQAVEGKGNIWISGKEDTANVTVIIRDDGKGISRDAMNHIFDPFYTTKPEGKGTGLGLAICQQIVHRWGGDITITSKEKKGTTVSVVLPKG